MAKWISLGLVGAGALAAALFGIVRMNALESIARANADAALRTEEAAKRAERQAKSEAATAASKESAKANEARIAEEKRKTQEAAAVEAQAAAAKAEDDRIRAVAEKEKAVAVRAASEAQAAAAADTRKAALAGKEAEKLALERAKTEKEAEELKARAAADALARQKLVSDKVIAEAKILEHRRLDLEGYERELNDYKRELDERERALRPEKTLNDIASPTEAAEDKAARDAPAALPENDKSLPAETRELCRARRLADEAADAAAAATRSNTIARLERLYALAVKEDRVVDADFISGVLKRMFPGWQYGQGDPQRKKEEKKEEEVAK